MGAGFLRIPLSPPPAGTTPEVSERHERSRYAANDGSVGDLDGDGHTR